MKKIILSVFLASLIVLPTSNVLADTASCVSITHNLKYQSGDAITGGDVTRLQTFLNKAGYLTAAPSGYFGSMTLAAVKQFQGKQGIDTTGFVGALTRGAVGAESCNTGAAPSGGSSTATNPSSGTATTIDSNICSVVLTYPYLNALLTEDSFQTVSWTPNDKCTSTTSVIAVAQSLDGKNEWVISSGSTGAAATTGSVGTDLSRMNNTVPGLYKVAIKLLTTKQVISNPVQANFALSTQHSSTPTISSISVNSVPNDGQTLITLYGTHLDSTVAVYVSSVRGTKIIPETIDSAGTSLTFYVPKTVGIANYQLVVSNDGVITSNAFSLSVTAPTFSRYAISTSYLQNAIVAQSYTSGIQATGFLENYTWSVSSGSLPPGLTLKNYPDGYLAPALLSGIPQTAGQYTFTIQATDGTNIAKQPYTMTVLPDPNATSKVPLIYSLSTYSAATGTSVTITGTRFASSSNYVLYNNRVAAGPLSSSDGKILTFEVPSMTSPNCNLFTKGGYCPYNLQVLTPNTYSVAVISPGGTSNGLDFTLLPPTY